ncbi:DUF4367 domain-containing protein [Mediterraneibacter glycyrrhizinilyticus]|uniref:DUF4367 domain-containing protein n=1 Tax=Mediterraneibacter glycyrrhizinilyticus TaxID=342942 RepID=UPI0025AB2D07|nr:DUF4367 domain-containing protein [Mediterraneibacter glycyrrhizinilyticus]MDN0060113.1 DUF4367 domain-containing protein [Mediterraneibacter glycyrrhizinilyticus]
MKELKKLSLKEEVDRQAQKIEEEVRNRDDLDDIKVSENMETSLFNKIQEYEYDKRIKKVVHRSRKKRRLFLAIAAVLILVCGSVITGTGSKSYWKVLWERVAGDEEANIVNVEDMDAEETDDWDEVQVFNEIRKEIGISPIRFGYIPQNMVFIGHELNKEQGRAVLFYKYNGQIIRYSMYMNNTDSSYGQTEVDTLINEYKMEVDNNIIVKVREYSVVDYEENRYVAKFEYKDAQYELIGLMEKEEFDKIVKNLFFYDEIT